MDVMQESGLRAAFLWGSPSEVISSMVVIPWASFIEVSASDVTWRTKLHLRHSPSMPL